VPAPTLQFEPVPVADRVRTGVPLALVPVYSRRVTVLESPWAAPRAPENSGELALDVLPSEGWTSVTVGATSSTVLAVTTTSRGASAPVSRLDRLTALRAVVSSPKLIVPFVVTALVTSASVHPSGATADVARTAAVSGGAVDQVIVFSFQLVLATEWTA
jgi:hypothetical protein